MGIVSLRGRGFCAMRNHNRATLIYNPAARGVRRGLARELTRIEKALKAYGIQADMVPTQRSSHACLLAREAVSSGADLIIAWGGDGTINEVVNGMARSPVPLLVLPAGTGNVLAKEIRLPGNPLKSLALARTGSLRRVALGKVDQRYFLLMAGIGVDASVVAAVNPRLKRTLGKGAFWLAGLQRFLQGQFPEFELRINGEIHRGTFALVARARNYGGPFSIVPRADLDSDKLHVCLFERSGRWPYLRYLLVTVLGRHLSLSDVKYLEAETVEARANHEVWFQLDGELIGTLPQTFSIEKDALSLVVPPASSGKQEP